MKLTWTVAVLILTSRLALAQRVSFGFTGGTNLTRDFPISRTLYQDPDHPSGLTTFDLFSDTHSLIAGVSMEVELSKNFSFEGNALHRTLQLKRRIIFPEGTTRDDGADLVTTWEFPLLLKYRLPQVGSIRPFLEGGPSFRTRHNPGPTEPSQIGATIGAGAEFRAGRFRVSPSIRYTSWQYDGDYPRFATKRDQIEFLTNFSYATSLPEWNVRGRKLRFGFIGGTPFTGGLDQPPLPERIDELHGYIAGLAVEVELNRRFSVEADGLYRPFRANRIFNAPGFDNASSEFTVLTWEIPVLAKYRWRTASKIQPVAEAGPSFRPSGNLNGYNPSALGFAAGGGVETNYRALKAGSILRFTRWGDRDAANRRMPTQPNQVELLFSFTF